MAAVNAHASGDETGQKDAATLASLLSESIKISISLSQAMNLKSDEGNPDAIRVALATLAGGLIGETYRQTGRLPGEAESRRISKALESVIVFADNFAPAAEHTQRLKTLEDQPPFFDPVQTNIYAIHALLPAIAAVEEFSFGQSETRLIQDIAERLRTGAKDLQSSLTASANPMGEMVILQALARVYASAHRSEILSLKSGGDSASANLDKVWAAYDRQVRMLEVLLTSMTGTPQSSSAGGSSRVRPDASPEEPAPTAPPAASPPQAGGSPMSFFKKK